MSHLADKLTFNKCSIEDLEKISALAEKIWPISFADILTKDQIEYMLKWMYSADKLNEQFQKGHLFFLAKKGELDIGFVGLELNYPDKEKLRVHKIYLDPSLHGKKIGKWMMDEVEEVAAELKMKYLHLNVNRHNAAVDFYLKNGFTTIHTEDIDIGQGYFMNDFVMLKELN